ncbi:unnamed protein product [Kluyveromyces dobzhanskii CBS 2104]|uniref:WGS project CCBQ000000000 data, contig 00016 n=1 Tax=Kluyveromyces dobzhanskii CBS 2104 TaxID=1427455 RepID=A0A0A8KZU9_9SACH|nr:unnamed protein product [Kluyveromyces dobzhanskii CBS 2104]
MDQLNQLLLFAEQNSVVLPSNVEFKQVEGKGICCIATEDIEQVIFQLPANLIITKDLSNKHFGDLVKCQEHHNTWLKLFLSKLRFSDEVVYVDGVNVTDQFAPYVMALPSEVDSPLVWNARELGLLNGTNLYISLKDKLQSIYNEWWGCIKNTTFQQKQYDIGQLSIEEIYDQITSKVFSGEKLDFFSFPAFLSSHLIFTSRAFPERIINPDCAEFNVILLPVLDLLNHENRSRIQWSCSNEGSFVFEKLEKVEKGTEICNNYGAKGNEELLYGYGFVIEGNEFDNLALKLKLPLSVIENILESGSVYLPTFDDYTTYAFDSGKHSQEGHSKTNDGANSKTVNDFRDGILYFINSNLESLKPLLDLFSLLSRNENENATSLRCQLTSLQSLRNALKHKLHLITDAEPLELPVDLDISEYRKKCASIYKSGQVSILKDSSNNLKRLQKHILSSYKPHVVSTKSIRKHDVDFHNDYLRLYNDTDNPEPADLSDEFEYAIAWLMVRTHKDSLIDEYSKYRWVIDQFTDYLSVYDTNSTASNAGKSLHSHFFPNGNDKISVTTMQGIVDFINNETFLMESSGAQSVPVFIGHIDINYS